MVDYYLTFLVILPLLGIIVCSLHGEFLRVDSYKRGVFTFLGKTLVSFVTIFPFLISLKIWLDFDKLNPFQQFKTGLDFINIDSFYKMSLQLGVDGISIFFVMLTTFIMPFCILTLDSLENKDKALFAISLLFLESLLILSFCAIDLLLFFVCFEAVIIPMFIIMKRGSQSQKIKASYYFVLYTLAGSLPLFIGILFICTAINTTNIEIFYFCHSDFFFKYQNVLWWFFFFGFATKIPMFPVHI